MMFLVLCSRQNTRDAFVILEWIYQRFQNDVSGSKGSRQALPFTYWHIPALIPTVAARCLRVKAPLLILAGTDDHAQDYDGEMGDGFRPVSMPETWEFRHRLRSCTPRHPTLMGQSKARLFPFHTGAALDLQPTVD